MNTLGRTPAASCQPSTSGRTLSHAIPRRQTSHRSRTVTVVSRAATTTRAERAVNDRSARATEFESSMSSVSLDSNGAVPATKTYGSFDKMLEGNDLPVLVDFHAHWCGPCQMMGHVVGSLSKRLEGAVTCVRIDCDKYPALASRYSVQALPTLVLFKDGKLVDKVEGYVGLQPLLDRVNYYLGRPMGPGRTFRGARN